ncbi:MAG: VOC family protein [Candidatus Kariarchaeaceae archaeon]|jgi:lactoylglutathione lyase
MLKKISHIVVYVTNMENSIGFYHEILGLPIRKQSDHWTEVGGSENGVFIGLHPSQNEIPASDNSIDIAFQVEDIRNARKQLEQKGVIFYDEITQVSPTSWYTSFRDPDGNNLSIVKSE